MYFVAGMIIMRVKYEKTGTDIIPNKAFWTSLPSLVKVKTSCILPIHVASYIYDDCKTKLKTHKVMPLNLLFY